MLVIWLQRYEKIQILVQERPDFLSELKIKISMHNKNKDANIENYNNQIIEIESKINGLELDCFLLVTGDLIINLQLVSAIFLRNHFDNFAQTTPTPPLKKEGSWLTPLHERKSG